MNRDESDEELVGRILGPPEGDLRAFDALVRRYQERIVTNCRYITRVPEESQDLAQEVFVKAYFALRRFEKRASFKTWLQRIKVNHCLNYMRKQEGKTMVDLEDPKLEGRSEVTVAASAHRSAEAMDDREKIARVLEEMNDTLRVPLILRDMDGCSYQEIAEMLGVGMSAVKMRIKRARQEFRSRYGSRSTGRRRGQTVSPEMGAP